MRRKLPGKEPFVSNGNRALRVSDTAVTMRKLPGKELFGSNDNGTLHARIIYGDAFSELQSTGNGRARSN